MSFSKPCAPCHPPIPPKIDPKPRPPIPRKPAPIGLPPLSTPHACSPVDNCGKVKHIVEKFSQQDIVGNGQTADTTAPQGKPKRGPTVKPKPKVDMLPTNTHQAPPQPSQRKRCTQRNNKKPVEAEAVAMPVEAEAVAMPVEAEAVAMPVEAEAVAMPEKQDEVRPVPESKKVEALEFDMVGMTIEEVESGTEEPAAPACRTDCSCICHLERPGMRLVWVPEADEEEESEGEYEDESGEEADKETEDNEEGKVEGEENEEQDKVAACGATSSEVEERTQGAQKADSEGRKFLHSLDYAIKRRNLADASCTSEAESMGVLNPETQSLSGLSSMVTCADVENSIYEDVLDVAPVAPKRKPLRRSKLSAVFSIENAEYQPEPSGPNNDPPPTVPPRVPLIQERPKSPRSNAVPRGIPLPLPSADEWKMLRPSSPNSQLTTAASNHSQGNHLHPQLPSPLLPQSRRKEPHSRASSVDSSLRSQSAWCTPHFPYKENKSEHTGDDDIDAKEEELTCVTPPHKTLKDWKSQFQNEPLYQTYRATVITKEIRRQTVCRNISKTSADYNMDLGAGWASAGVPNGGPGRSTLWQNLPAVRDSGILTNLSPDECKLQESMFEVLTSEASYLRSLRVLTDHFMESRELDDTLTISDKKRLFSNILRIREVSERFQMDLEERINSSVVISDVCDIIYYHAQHNFPAFVDYMRNQVYQEQTYSNLMQTNTQFQVVIKRLQEAPQCQRLPFFSFLLLPFQRITRIKLLIENIVKRSKEGTKEEFSASKAHISVCKIIDDCTTEVWKMKQTEEVIRIANMLEFDKLKRIPIISQNRFLEKQGELQEMIKGGTVFTLRPKYTPIYLFLFNDLLILASKKSSERYVVIDHAHRSLVQVQSMSEASPGPALENCFLLTLLANHQGRTSERLLKAETKSSRDRWIEAFPNPERVENMNEVVYEDWDCPQVQCIDQYVAKQADELNLEPTEIINVLRKTNEGWYEGAKMSDGQKGWFPVSNVQEITNEHVRRRNIRDRYRVMEAAHAATKARMKS